jgi:serine/threonine protein kinase/Flp pilus assembly protein TadD
MTALPEQPTAAAPDAAPASGVDDPRVLAALEEYQAALEAGQQPNRAAFLARYPEVADALGECLDGLALVRSAASDLSPSPGPFLLPHHRLGDYRILRELGRGGMGLVYEAEQVSLGRRVALKVLPPASALDDRQLARFHNEARAAAHLHHPHVVPVFAVGCEAGIHYYAMQLIEGPSLAEVVDQLSRPASPTDDVPTQSYALPGVGTPPPRTTRPATTDDAVPGAARDRATHTHGWGDGPRRAAGLGETGPAYCGAVARLGVQAADALAHAHDLGVVHRDVKPSNLLLDGAGSLWVADFGLARFREDVRLTRPGDVLGTLRYLSPEQARGGPADHRADVYALGITLYEVLTLRPAFPGEDRHQVLCQVALAEPAAPRRLNPALPRDLETVILKAISKRPDDRYADARALGDDLKRFLDGQPVLARRPSPLDRAARWCGRHRAIVLTAVAGLLLTTAALAFGLVRTYQARKQAEQNLQHALRAVDRMTRVAERWLSRAPYLEPVQRELLEEALASYEEFLRDNGSDPSLRRETARAYRRVATIRAALGRHAEAEEAYARALPLLEALAAESPGDAESREELALCHNNRGNLYQSRGRLAEAEAEYREARTLFAELVKGSPDIADYWDGFAGSGNNLGVVLHRLDRLDDADKALREALAVQRKLTNARPTVPAYRHDEAGLLNNLANLLRATGHGPEAEKTYREALELQAPLVKRFPADPAYRQAHAVSRHGLGLLLSKDRPEKAREQLEDAARLRGRLMLDFPSVPAYKEELAASLHALGPVLKDLNQPAEAKEALQRAVDLRKDLAASSPDNADYARELADSRQLLESLR